MKKLSIFTLLGLFLSFFPHVSFANEPSLVISEIASYQASDLEWVEIVNVSQENIDLTNYYFFENDINHTLSLYHGEEMILKPNDYAVICNKCDKLLASVLEIPPILFLDSSWGSLNESGEYIGIKNAQKEFVEGIFYPSSMSGSIQRKDLFSTDMSLFNWFEIDKQHSMGLPNIISEEEKTTSIQTSSEEHQKEVLEEPSHETQNNENKNNTILIQEDIITHTGILPGTTPLNLVLVMNQIQETYDPSNQFNEYEYMLYLLDDYDKTISLHEYLQSMSSSVLTQTEIDPDETKIDNEDLKETSTKENQNDTTIPDESAKQPSDQTTIFTDDEMKENLPILEEMPIESDEQTNDEILAETDIDEEIKAEATEFERSCIAWWELHKQLSEQ